MVNAEITDEDRKAAEAALCEAISASSALPYALSREEETAAFESLYITSTSLAIAIAREVAYAEGRQAGLRQAADYAKSFPGLKAHVLAILALKEPK